MSLIALKKENIKLPDDQSIDNCFTYTKSISFAFARNHQIHIVYDLTTLEDYKFAIKELKVADENPLLLYFTSYSEHKLGKMPLVIDENFKINDEEDEYTTNASVLAVKEEIDGIDTNNIAKYNFIKSLKNFNRNKYSDIMKLVFGDNLAVILNPNGTYEIYGLELSATKKWVHSSSGIIYSDDDFKTKTYNNYSYNYNQNANSCYDDEYSAYAEYYDNNVSRYTCEKCKTKVSSVFITNGMEVCTNCYNKMKKDFYCNASR